jgi:hypothetical protein
MQDDWVSDPDSNPLANPKAGHLVRVASRRGRSQVAISESLELVGMGESLPICVPYRG